MYDTLDSRRPFGPRIAARDDSAEQIEVGAGSEHRQPSIPSLILLVATLFSLVNPFLNSAQAQDGDEIVKVDAPAGNADEQTYAEALNFVPDSAAGVIRIPNLPELCEAVGRNLCRQVAGRRVGQALL